MFETYRGVVFPWHCDQMGHLNTRHYAAMFDDAGAHLLHHLGFDLEAGIKDGIGWADVECRTVYRREAACGALLLVESAPLKVGRSALTVIHRMQNLSTGQLAAEQTVVSVCLDLTRRKSRPLPQVVVARCSAAGILNEQGEPQP